MLYCDVLSLLTRFKSVGFWAWALFALGSLEVARARPFHRHIKKSCDGSDRSTGPCFFMANFVNPGAKSFLVARLDKDAAKRREHHRDDSSFDSTSTIFIDGTSSLPTSTSSPSSTPLFFPSPTDNLSTSQISDVATPLNQPQGSSSSFTSSDGSSTTSDGSLTTSDGSSTTFSSLSTSTSSSPSPATPTLAPSSLPPLPMVDVPTPTPSILANAKLTNAAVGLIIGGSIGLTILIALLTFITVRLRRRQIAVIQNHPTARPQDYVVNPTWARPRTQIDPIPLASSSTVHVNVPQKTLVHEPQAEAEAGEGPAQI